MKYLIDNQTIYKVVYENSGEFVLEDFVTKRIIAISKRTIAISKRYAENLIVNYNNCRELLGNYIKQSEMVLKAKEKELDSLKDVDLDEEVFNLVSEMENLSQKLNFDSEHLDYSMNIIYHLYERKKKYNKLISDGKSSAYFEEKKLIKDNIKSCKKTIAKYQEFIDIIEEQEKLNKC